MILKMYDYSKNIPVVLKHMTSTKKYRNNINFDQY